MVAWKRTNETAMGKNLHDLEGKNHYSELERVDIHQMKTGTAPTGFPESLSA